MLNHLNLTLLATILTLTLLLPGVAATNAALHNPPVISGGSGAVAN